MTRALVAMTSSAGDVLSSAGDRLCTAGTKLHRLGRRLRDVGATDKQRYDAEVRRLRASGMMSFEPLRITPELAADIDRAVGPVGSTHA